MRRIALFCYFNRDNRVTCDIDIICRELCSISDELVIVVNGCCDNAFYFKKYTETILYRPNTGLDAGAYKFVLSDIRFSSRIMDSDELVFCNNSFFGPFIPLKDIFAEMSNIDSDFWGLTSSERNLSLHLQSYFLVFRKPILQSEVFWNYFKNHIDESEVDYLSVCGSFENGLFHELLSAGFNWGAYVRNIKCDPYSNPYGSVALDKVPILKKKAFSNILDNNEIKYAIEYIRRNYSYPISIFKQVSEELYDGIDLSIDEIGLPKPKNNFHDNRKLRDRSDIFAYIRNHKSVYIYGAGYYAKDIFLTFFFYKDNPKLKGFIVSKKDSGVNNVLFKYPVFEYSSDKIKKDKGIIIAASNKLTKEIEAFLKKQGHDDCLSLWKDEGECRF